jgi:predicted XRE-type DNA-binding protein
MQCKSQLADEIARSIQAKRLTQTAASELLGIDQSKISRITRGQFRGIRESKMLELVAKLGHDVTIHIGPARKKQADLSWLLRDQVFHDSVGPLATWFRPLALTV